MDVDILMLSVMHLFIFPKNIVSSVNFCILTVIVSVRSTLIQGSAYKTKYVSFNRIKNMRNLGTGSVSQRTENVCASAKV